ncbi:transposase [Azospirillaceae bacterium]
MKATLTAGELAELARAGMLDKLPATERNVRACADRESWPRERRSGKGGGWVYPISGLPAPIREAIVDQAARGGASPEIARILELNQPQSQCPATQESKLPAPIREATPPTLLKDWQREIRDARASLLAEWDRLAEMTGGVESALRTLLKAAQTRTLSPRLLALVPIANHKDGGGETRTLSRRTLYRWRAMRTEGIGALTPEPPRAAPPPPWWLASLLVHYRSGKVSVPMAMEDLRKEFPDRSDLPSLSTARAWLNKMHPLDVAKGREGPNALRARKRFKRRTTEHMEPMDVVVMDGHQLKAESVIHPLSGKAFRPEMFHIMDVATRRVVAWAAGMSENSLLTMEALNRMVEAVGVPAIVYSDNGKGLCSKLLEDDIVGYYDRLGATHETGMPGSPQGRGNVERLNQSLWIRGARRLAGYVGRDADEEKVRLVRKLREKDLKESKKTPLAMDWPVFIAWAQQQVDDYNNRSHSALAGKSPNQAWQDFLDDGWSPTLLTEEEIADLRRPEKEVSTNNGEVRLENNIYSDVSLEAFDGRRVRLSYDIYDLSRVWVRNSDGQLICIARIDANKTEYFTASAIEDAKEKRLKGQLKRLGVKEEEFRAQAAPGIGATYEVKPPPEVEKSVVVLSDHRKKEPAEAPTLQSDEAQWMARAKGLLDQQDAGEALTERDARWLERNKNAPWLRAVMINRGGARRHAG